MANGIRSPIEGLTDGEGGPIRSGVHLREVVAAYNSQKMADIPETRPANLAQLVLDAAGHLIDTTSGRPGDQPLAFHCGLPSTLAALLCLSLSEHIIHGYDMATAVGRPWPIEPAHAGLALYGVTPLFALTVNPETTTGLTVAYGIHLRGVGCSVVRFLDGEYHVEPGDSSSVDCTISADPVAYLLVGARRLSPWSAIALGLISANGPKPELALRFQELFVYP
jgi:hypothetical protein